MSQVSSHPHHHHHSGQSSNTSGPPQTSQGPPGHYVGGGSGSSNSSSSSYSGARRVNFVEGAGAVSRRSMAERQDSFGHLGFDGGDMYGSRSSFSLADDVLATHRRGDSREEPSTAALDAAILDLTRRRLSMNPPPGGDGGRDSHARWERSSITSYAHSASSLAARQQQLQAQQRELEQRQRELEIQRQQLMAGMREHAKSTSLFAAQHGMGNMNSSQQQWWVCQVCNSKAFASHDEAMQHEISCCPEPQKFDPMAGAMPIPSDHHMSGLGGGYPTSPGFDSGLEIVPVGGFSEMKEPMPLSMPSDKDWLTPLHCFVRRHCVQIFTAKEDDVSTPSKGKRKPIQVGQVGIRCPHCHSEESKGKTRERGSVYYPTSISSIYNATMNLLQRHLHNCSAVPADIMRRYETLKSDDARSGTSKRYWIESSLSLGLVDTPSGIRYSAATPPPLPSLSSHQHSTGSYSVERRNSDDFFSSNSNAVSDLNQESSESPDSPTIDPATETAAAAVADVDDGSVQDTEQALADSAPLVTPEDEPYSTKFSHLLISQMQPCVFTEADRLGKRKGLPAGFPGLACRHCFGGYGSGRFFPSSIKTLSDTSKTLNVLHNHMMRCRKCPQEVRDNLEKLRATHDEERGKMKFGSQKAFFARVWERLHKNGSPGVPPKRKAASPPLDYSRLAGVAPLPYMDHARYFGPPITAPDNMSLHHSFSGGMDAFGHPADIPDSKRRRSG